MVNNKQNMKKAGRAKPAKQARKNNTNRKSAPVNRPNIMRRPKLTNALTFSGRDEIGRMAVKDLVAGKVGFSWRINPLTLGRLATVSSAFQRYRLDRLRITAQVSASSFATGMYATAVVADSDDVVADLTYDQLLANVSCVTSQLWQPRTADYSKVIRASTPKDGFYTNTSNEDSARWQSPGWFVALCVTQPSTSDLYSYDNDEVVFVADWTVHLHTPTLSNTAPLMKIQSPNTFYPTINQDFAPQTFQTFKVNGTKIGFSPLLFRPSLVNSSFFLLPKPVPVTCRIGDEVDFREIVIEATHIYTKFSLGNNKGLLPAAYNPYADALTPISYDTWYVSGDRVSPALTGGLVTGTTGQFGGAQPVIEQGSILIPVDPLGLPLHPAAYANMARLVQFHEDLARRLTSNSALESAQWSVMNAAVAELDAQYSNPLPLN